MQRDELDALLKPFGQQHVLRFWDNLTADQQQRLARQIQAVNLAQLDQLVRGDHDDATDWEQLSQQATAPETVRVDSTENTFTDGQAYDAAEVALRCEQLGMILVAGGQGTRLGFDDPKGMFPLGPVSKRTLFEILIDHLLAVSNRYDIRIPLYLMTSAATHQRTVEYLDQHDRFGLEPDDLFIFQQASMPAVDAETGHLLMTAPGELAISPDGHGGMLGALARSGALEHAQRRGVHHLFYGQVDNPLLQVCDLKLVGHHLLAESEMTTQVVPKRFPLERVGNVVSVDGRMRIIEYSDLPDEAAHRQDEAGQIALWAGNIAVHVFKLAFLEKMLNRADALPFHCAHKAVTHIDPQGKLVEPAEPNAYKFERFIFDLLPEAANAIAVEAQGSEAFAPVKNSNDDKVDTPNTAQAAMVALHRSWLEAAGVEVADDVAVEINPRWALDASEVALRVEPGGRIDQPTYFGG